MAVELFILLLFLFLESAVFGLQELPRMIAFLHPGLWQHGSPVVPNVLFPLLLRMCFFFMKGGK